MKIIRNIKVCSVVFLMSAFSTANAQYFKPSIDGSFIIDNCGSKNLLLEDLGIIPQSKYFKTIASNYLFRIKIVQYFKPTIDGSWLSIEKSYNSKNNAIFYT